MSQRHFWTALTFLTGVLAAVFAVSDIAVGAALLGFGAGIGFTRAAEAWDRHDVERTMTRAKERT